MGTLIFSSKNARKTTEEGKVTLLWRLSYQHTVPKIIWIIALKQILSRSERMQWWMSGFLIYKSGRVFLQYFIMFSLWNEKLQNYLFWRNFSFFCHWFFIKNFNYLFLTTFSLQIFATFSLLDILVARNVGKGGRRKGGTRGKGMQDSRNAGQKGCRIVGMQDSRNAG